MRILVAYHHYEQPDESRATILDHIRTLEHSSDEHEIVYYNANDHVPSVASIDDSTPIVVPDVAKQRFDAVILHYTLLSMRALGLGFYRYKQHVAWIGGLDTIKVALPQDEGSYAGVLDEWLFELGVSIVFSIHFAEGRTLYPLMRRYADIYPCLPGYIDDGKARELAPRLVKTHERPKDIVYRARNLPYRIGRYSQLKHEIADAVGSAAQARGLECDISTRNEDTVLGPKWLPFLASSKAVIGTQGGYGAIDWRGEIPAKLEVMLAEKPGLTFDEFDAHMPSGWDGHGWLTITPRHFEAVITKTCQVLVEGDYKGILRPNRHFIPIAADWSNADEVVDRLCDHDGLQEMAQTAYEEIFESGKYSYRVFADMIVGAIESQRKRDKMTDRTDQQTSDEDRESALQRELIAERHHNAMIAQRLVEFGHKISAFVQNTEGASEQLYASVNSQLQAATQQAAANSQTLANSIAELTDKITRVEAFHPNRYLLVCALLLAFIAGVGVTLLAR